MAQRPSVRWNQRNERWMAWVRFPDGSRRKVERADKADAQHDLDALLAMRAQALAPLWVDRTTTERLEEGLHRDGLTGSRRARSTARGTVIRMNPGRT